MGLEQSNTSLVYNDEKYVLKFFRRIYADRNPDYEMSRFLSEKKDFKNTPAYLGSLQIKDSEGTTKAWNNMQTDLEIEKLDLK